MPAPPPPPEPPKEAPKMVDEAVSRARSDSSAAARAYAGRNQTVLTNPEALGQASTGKAALLGTTA